MISDFVRKVSYFIIVLTMSIACILYFLQVIFRYAIHLPLNWTEEISVLAMVWMAFVGPAALIKGDELIRVKLIKYKGKTKEIISIITDLIMIIPIGFIVVYALMLAVKFNTTELPATGISKAVVYVSLFVGSLFMIIEFLGKIRKALSVLTNRNSIKRMNKN